MGSTIAINNDPVLTNIYNDYMPKDQWFIRDEFLPVYKVGSESAEIIDLGTSANQAIQVHADYVAGKASTPEIEVNIEKSSGYQTERHALKIAITKDIAKKFDVTSWDAGFSKAERTFTKMLKKAAMVSREKGLADTVFSAATYGAGNKVTLSGSDQFSDKANSDPLGVFEDVFQAINDASGFLPNVAIINMQTFLALRNHPALKHVIAVSSDGANNVRALNKAEVAAAIGVEKLLIANAMYESAAKGATSSKAQIWGKNMGFYYINPNPQPEIFEKSFGYTFQLDEAVVDTYEAQDPKYVRYVRIDEEYDDYILDATTGYLISDVIA